MARNVAIMAIGVVVGLVGGAALGLHADPASAEIDAAAQQAHVDVVDLAGAVNSVGVDPFTYLRSTGELPPLAMPREPAVPPPAYSARVECIIAHESRGDPSARNRSGASGLGQFLPGTWASTPQGRAGLSVFNAAANRAAIAWMLSVGRAREFVAVTAYGC